ncbi:ras GTPase-activating-like protein IQGAP3 [Erpetoichthys calabaricus]|uniref:ras GTPase-activating-like protein IQGAP3 n=1 Tax=Erpetoichthys calabaricus TaxID=27687 RepID=UPI00109FC323|nr:ras GTPase-activating-like protein IQGAP3 [Erpetoichthys calabaricus]
MEGDVGVQTRTGYERLTAEEMDEQRAQSIAYQYLCRLEEAKRWMEACLNEELPAPTELEEGLRNGVLLAKLGNYFAPNVVPVKKIYDYEQARFKVSGLHFRHTDNINYWRKAMVEIGLPMIFYPETTDVYDKKNMPRVIYCIHALSLYLFRLGLAPQIHDLCGKVKFTEEEINNMKRELDKYGIQMPAFSKIGGILANELSVDEAAMHAAVIAINKAVEKGSAEETGIALRNPSAMLLNLDDCLVTVYLEVLQQARAEKAVSARNRINIQFCEEKDIYEEYLTQVEIQGNINKINVHAALEMVDESLERRDPLVLYSALESSSLCLRSLLRENADWYLEQLSLDRQQKALDLGCADVLDKEELQQGVFMANQNAVRTLKTERAVFHINAAIKKGIAKETLKELMNANAELPDVYHCASELYQQELAILQAQKIQGALLHEELFVAVEMLSAVALINKALEAGDANEFWKALISPSAGLADIDEEMAQRYYEELRTLKENAVKAKAGMLTWNDLQSGLNDVNSLVQHEHDRVVSIELINQALQLGNPQDTLAALLLPSVGLSDILEANGRRYYDVLLRAKQKKAKDSNDPAAELWLDEIQQGVWKANQESKNTLKLSLGLAALNQAVKEGRPLQTLKVLSLPELGLCSVVPQCAAAYQRELYTLKMAKMCEGENHSPWVRQKVRCGGCYYFHLQRLEGTWDRPEDFAENKTHLDRDEVQYIITQVTASYDKECLWKASIPFIVRLQARARGYLLRRQLQSRKCFLQRHVPAIITIQSHWRRFLQQRAYQERLCFLQANSVSAVKIQAWVRMWLAQSKYRARLRHFKNNVDSIIKIQAFFRANKAREDYRMLVCSQNPPLSVVRKFTHLLEQNNVDIIQEKELLRLREEVVRTIRSNQQLENDLNLMDLKIGLLVRNRITLQEVVLHSKKLTRKNKEQLSDMMALDKQKGLKSLNKEKREKLEAYQHLFYLLQTQPIYLAKLIFQMPHNRTTKFMESVIFMLYNYASDCREAYLLLQLFTTALREEIKSRVDQVHEIVKGNPTVIRLLVSFYRNTRGQNALRQILGPTIKEVLQDKSINIKTDPVDIYKTWINQTESQTGQKSSLPYDVTPEKALLHPEVQRRLNVSVCNLKSMTDKFLTAITSNLDQLPYGMRFIAKVLKNSLCAKFPGTAIADIYKIVGNLLYYRYMNPAVVAPDGFDIVDYSAGVVLHPEHRRTLGSIARVLQHAAANKLFEGDSAHLQALNDYISQTHLRFRKFFKAACEVPDPEERFNMNEYSEMVALNKPVIYITLEELINTHRLLLEHQDSIAPDHDDPLHELLDDLGEVPTVQSLIGESMVQPTDPNAEQLLANYGKIEVSLTLANKFDIFKSSEDQPDIKGLLLSTKQLIIDVIKAQQGDSLPLILRTAASVEQEAEHFRIMQIRALQDARSPEKLKRNQSIIADSNLSMEEKKRKILRNVRKLEALGVLDSHTKYTQLLNDISKDIRNQRRYRQRRQAELVKLRQTLQSLHAKSAFYGEQIDYYNQYIKTCLDNLTSKEKLNNKVANGKGKKEKRPILSYTAARLHEKGVLLEVEDLPVSQFRNVIFDIVRCEEEVGTFQVKARFMGVDMEKFPLRYQDLLQLQYEGVAVMKMLKAKVNVNLLIFLLNKKFFKK